MRASTEPEAAGAFDVAAAIEQYELPCLDRYRFTGFKTTNELQAAMRALRHGQRSIAERKLIHKRLLQAKLQKLIWTLETKRPHILTNAIRVKLNYLKRLAVKR
jgi:hypothetical protein